MNTQSHKRAIGYVFALTLAATLVFTALVGAKTSSPALAGEPTLGGRSFQCDPEDGPYSVSFTWTRQMPGNSAWLGTVTVHKGADIVLNNKPIQVFDAMPTNPGPMDLVHRQFQAQDGSFYCSDLSIQPNTRTLKNSVNFSGCRNWVLTDQFCAFPRVK